jgi:hypothetical protein
MMILFQGERNLVCVSDDESDANTDEKVNEDDEG